MLDKLKFNNLVISNKKGIQQSRIQTINKLVHKIRKLKTLLEKHPDNTKCKERIRKSTETMEILKKLKRVDIMKKVLLLDKPAAAVITNGLATPEEVGVALLTMNKVMQGLIKRFKTELHLNEDESDEWKQALRENSKRRQKIERTEEKRRKRMEMKQQKALGRKRQEWLEENQKGMDLEKLEGAEDTELNVSNTGSWKVEELEIEKDVEEQGDNVQSNTKQIKKRPIPEKTLNKKTNKVNTKKPKLDVKLEKEAELQGNSEQEEELESDKELTNFNTSKMKVEHVSDEEEPEQEEEDLVVDPFFITDTGENYLSTAVVKRNQNDEDDNNENKRDLHMIKLNNSDKKSVDFRERRQQNRNNNQRDNRAPNNRNSWNNDKDRSTQNKWNNKQSNGRDKFSQNKWSDKKQTPQDFRNKNSKNAKEEDKLHPSWAAKQKLKPVITGFQGKKITFGDDESNNNNSNRPLQQSSKKFESPKLAKTAEDNLHPSWAAKQKLKPTITAFQGKKITFDNDD